MSRSVNGFSLLELLVAVSILSLALIPILFGQGDSLRNMARLHHSFLARVFAENTAIELLAMPELPRGVRQGRGEQAGLSLVWQAEVSDRAAPPMRLIHVRVLSAEGAPLAVFSSARRR